MKTTDILPFRIFIGKDGMLRNTKSIKMDIYGTLYVEYVERHPTKKTNHAWGYIPRAKFAKWAAAELDKGEKISVWRRQGEGIGDQPEFTKVHKSEDSGI
ncbi:MAG: hypothetical protein PHW76_09800 [Alphaproteobacteria bacterium]|nr:hypothetical protein [Alphaproteobacteria bacterium]